MILAYFAENHGLVLKKMRSSPQGGAFAPLNIDLQQFGNGEPIQKPIQRYCNDRVRATAASERVRGTPLFRKVQLRDSESVSDRHRTHIDRQAVEIR